MSIDMVGRWLEALVRRTAQFSIAGYEEEYSKQEIHL